MSSNVLSSQHAYIWIWLPDQSNPVVAGQLMYDGSRYVFRYGKSYLERQDAIALSPFELPLSDETAVPAGMRAIPSCIRDALPDAWGRRLLDYQYPQFQKNEIDYGLLSTSDRIGALDFQTSSALYHRRNNDSVDWNAVERLATVIEKNQPIPKALISVLMHGTSIGGARPKCLMTVNHENYIAKFSLSTDYFPFLKAEFIAMRLAKKIGLNVAAVSLHETAGRDILFIKRFDRYVIRKNACRKIMLSALSLLGLDELEARYASYIDLADLIRANFVDPKSQLCELYHRLVFNVLIGNTDDHARNHSAFWDGRSLILTPAYDICPQMRSGFEASQAMRIDGEDGQLSTLKNVLSVCESFMLTKKEAKKLIQFQIQALDKQWLPLCREAKLNANDQKRLWGSVIKSEFCLQGWR